MVRPAIPLHLTTEERQELERWVRTPTLEQRLGERARIVLALDTGISNKETAIKLGTDEVKVCRWRRRFAEKRMAGLKDEKRTGRPIKYGHNDRLKIVETACRPPEATSHWSVRQLASALEGKVGISRSRLQRVLSEMDLQPHRMEMWLNSQDPDFEAKEAEIVGLYMDPPKNALVISVDEKTGIQALDRKHPDKPMRPGNPPKREFEYVRRGTQSLFAALLVHQGKIIAEAKPTHTRVDFLDFLQHLHRVLPRGKQIHVIVDNLSTHKGDPVNRWLAKHSRVHMHFTPTHASWLNQIELWFSILVRRLLKRGIFTSSQDAAQQIARFIEEYNKSARPFAWTYQGKVLKI